MAAQYNLKKLLMGGFVDFIEHGSTVDANTTSSTAQPDDDPITNWTDASLGCALDVDFDKDEEPEDIYCPSEAGGYPKVTTYITHADYIDIKLKDHSEPIFRLLFGLQSKLTGATGQVPFSNRGERSISGWLRVRGKDQDGNEFAVLKLEVKMSLKEYPGWHKETTFPVVRFQVLDNALNDIIDTGLLVA